MSGQGVCRGAVRRGLPDTRWSVVCWSRGERGGRRVAVARGVDVEENGRGSSGVGGVVGRGRSGNWISIEHAKRAVELCRFSLSLSLSLFLLLGVEMVVVYGGNRKVRWRQGKLREEWKVLRDMRVKKERHWQG